MIRNFIKRKTALPVAGLGCMVIGAFQVHTVAGWFAAGIGLLLLDWGLDEPTR